MKPRVLIVEDEEPIAQAEQLILEDLYEVHLAKDGEEGLRMVEELKPDIVILDIMLPKKDGLDLCFTIRQNPALADVKIIMVSAKSMDVDEDKGMLIGADDYITKPFEPEELLHVVSQTLDAR